MRQSALQEVTARRLRRVQNKRSAWLGSENEGRHKGGRFTKSIHVILIVQDEFVTEYCGELITKEEFKRRLDQKNQRQEIGFYFMQVHNTQTALKHAKIPAAGC